MKSKQPSIHIAKDIQELLLHSKAITPITAEQTAELQKISSLDVSKYSEADVRAEIIDPVVRILGYQKETYFSLQREKSLKVLDGDLFIDYNMTLWSEAFWLIEAKKVKRKSLKFSTAELQQALQYAVHPEINAALVVLCDGRVIEVYDREESVTEPAARVEVKKLPEQFAVLQTLLSPWQAWFFQKRRVLRLVDRVLDHEMIPSRLDEFKQAVDRRFEEKRGKVIENWRKVHPISNDRSERDAALRSMSNHDLIEAEFFVSRSIADEHVIAKLLVERARPGAFDVMYQMFPDRPRDMNDHFVGSALRTLIEFDASDSSVNWLPDWLGTGRHGDGLEGGIKRLIAFGLSTFDGDQNRKLILQYSAAARRFAKVTMALIPTMTKAGKHTHELLRYSLEELHEAQYLSAPGSHNIRMLDGYQSLLTRKFVTACQDDRQNFISARAELKLKKLWQMERTLLGQAEAYWKGLVGSGIDGEINPTENRWVDYDNLGHVVLCILALVSKKWCQYALEMHDADIRRIAKSGSWQARKLIGIPLDARSVSVSDEEKAERFFYGDLALYRDLSAAYRFQAHS